MSFYGNVFQELTNAFASFIIQTQFNNATAKVVLEALGTGGEITFAPGNQWIELGADADNYICSIHHKPIDTNREGNTITPFGKAAAADTGTPIQFTAGDIVKVPNFKYDEAGHVIGTNGYSLYKLPINETESNIQDLMDRMVVIEEAESLQNTTIEEFKSTVESHTTTLEDLGERMATVEELGPKVDTLEKLTEEVDGLLGERVTMTKDADLTVTAVIGDFDTMVKDLKYTSVCEGLTTTTAMINGTNIAVNNNSLATKLALQKLCEALAEYNITIDDSTLWQI